MKSGLNKIKYIIEIIFPILEDLYDQYRYTEISDVDYQNLVFNHLEDLSITELKYLKKVKEIIQIALDNYAKNVISKPNMTYQIINNYINQEFGINRAYSKALDWFRKLNDFFKKFEILPTPAILIKLINQNSILKEMCNSILKYHYSEIILNDLANLFDNELLISTLRIYCLINNINFNQENGNLSDPLMSSSLRAYLEEINRIPLLTKWQETFLLMEAKNGNNDAKKILIESNLRLVVNVARKYYGKRLSFLDLIQEGNLGLMKAIEYFDLEESNDFKMYATTCIKNAIIYAISKQDNIVSHSFEVSMKINESTRTLEKLKKELNREPSLQEIAKEMNISYERAFALFSLQMDPYTIDSSMPDLEKSPEEMQMNKFKNMYIREVLEKCHLTNQEREVLKLRFGLIDGTCYTLKEIGNKFNVTKERIRQVEQKALGKMRNSSYGDSLREFCLYPEKVKKQMTKYQPTQLEPDISLIRKF